MATRHLAIDAMRYLLCLPVALLHSLPEHYDAAKDSWAFVLSILCRVAVPLYFISSGYFLRIDALPHVRQFTKPLLRLLPVYIFWMAAYFIFLWIDPVREWSYGLRDLLTGGTAYHLWFLPALGVALVIVGLGSPVVGFDEVGVICAALAVFALAHSSYHDVLELDGRASKGGFLVAPLFVWLGAWSARHDVKAPKQLLGGALIVSYVLLGVEEHGVARLSNSPLTSHDFMLLTFPVAVSAFLIVQSLDVSWSFGRLPRLSLGVYCGHLAFVWILLKLLAHVGALGVLLVAATSVILATALSVLIYGVPGLKRFVT